MPGTRRAILIGNAAYTGYPDLRCPLNDVEGLAAQLKDAERGAFDEVKRVKDRSSAIVKRELFSFLQAAEPTDTVLVYFSGHGDLDSSLALHFCTSDSQRDMLEVTAVASAFLWDVVAKCRATRKAVFLDCCYSGAAAGKVGKGGAGTTLRAEANTYGTYLMTASDAISTAQEKEGDRYGIFTKHLIEGIQSGEADLNGDGEITLDGLYSYVFRRTEAENAPKPNHHSGGQGHIVIAKSGRDPRKDRLTAVRKRLYQHVAEGYLTAETAQVAEQVASARPTEMAVWQTRIDGVIDDYMDERTTLAAFAEAVQKAQTDAATDTGKLRPDAAKSRTEGPEPSTDTESADKQSTDNQAAGTASPDPAIDTIGIAQNPLVLRYGIPAAVLAATPVLAAMFAGNGLVPGALMMTVTGWNLKANMYRLELGGVLANSCVFFFGLLAFIAGILG